MSSAEDLWPARGCIFFAQSDIDVEDLARGETMLSCKSLIPLIVAAGLCTAGAVVRTVAATAQEASPAPQAPNASVPLVAPAPAKVIAGQVEANKLLLLMDADKNGKVSRAEFMAFMAAEFDRLDINHDGELDVKELEQSQLSTARHGGGHR
jgi:hypothetical protein